MEVRFATRKLEKIFASQKELTRAYGPAQTKKIMMRMAVLRNAPNLATVPRTPPDRCHQLSQDRDEQYAVDLVHPFRIIFEIVDPIPRDKDGGIDLSSVTTIRILKMTDYH